ncbi:hypothetical protein B0H14DRAFT_2561838 [Mycena olivaceomarginata]|nr:hypothetical protein B0H14DRAFT_2561838 [Mycena olivaceomarginata]
MPQDQDYLAEGDFQPGGYPAYHNILGSPPFPHTPSSNGSYHNSRHSNHSKLSFSTDPTQDSFALFDDEPQPRARPPPGFIRLRRGAADASAAAPEPKQGVLDRLQPPATPIVAAGVRQHDLPLAQLGYRAATPSRARRATPPRICSSSAYSCAKTTQGQGCTSPLLRTSVEAARRAAHACRGSRRCCIEKAVEERRPGATIIPVLISTDKTQTTMFRNKAAYPVYMTIGNIPKDARRKPSRQALQDWMALKWPAVMEWFGVAILFLPSLRGLFRAVLEALQKADGNATEFTRACVEAGIKPIYHPFWEDLPYVNIFLSITSDVLHQLYEGVIKHVVAWVTEAFGPVEIDARCRRMPPNHNTRLFLKGITTLSRVSGTEHNQMCRILLGLVIDLQLPDRQSTSSLIRAVRGALDFLYLSQYPTQSTETISHLENALKSFHDNKHIFMDPGIRADFNFPKLHNLRHYPLIIKLWLDR